MNPSRSLGNQIGLYSLAVEGVAAHKAALPKEAAARATTLGKRITTIQQMNARQEKLKQDLARLTQQLRDERQQASADRASILRLVEATFGARDPRVREFRPTTEARVAPKRKSKGK